MSEEGMAGDGAQDVVADAGGCGETGEGGKDEQGIETSIGGDIEIEICTSVVVEDKIADCVCALDIVWVGFVQREERRGRNWQ